MIHRQSYRTSKALITRLQSDANKRSISYYAFLNEIIRQVVSEVQVYNRRSEPGTAYLDDPLRKSIKRKSQELHIPASEVIHLCLEEYYKDSYKTVDGTDKIPHIGNVA